MYLLRNPSFHNPLLLWVIVMLHSQFHNFRNFRNFWWNICCAKVLAMLAMLAPFVGINSFIKYDNARLHVQASTDWCHTHKTRIFHSFSPFGWVCAGSLWCLMENWLAFSTDLATIFKCFLCHGVRADKNLLVNVRWMGFLYEIRVFLCEGSF